MLDPANTRRDILADKGDVDGKREASLGRQAWRAADQQISGNSRCPID